LAMFCSNKLKKYDFIGLNAYEKMASRMKEFMSGAVFNINDISGRNLYN